MATVNWQDRIICDLQIHHGEPCIRGTRIAVAVIVASLADLSIDALLRQYPHLSLEDIRLRFSMQRRQFTIRRSFDMPR